MAEVLRESVTGLIPGFASGAGWVWRGSVTGEAGAVFGDFLTIDYPDQEAVTVGMALGPGAEGGLDLMAAVLAANMNMRYAKRASR